MQLRHTVGIENGNKRQQTGKSLKKFKKIATFGNKQEQTATFGLLMLILGICDHGGLSSRSYFSVSGELDFFLKFYMPFLFLQRI
jgi:hypothetical protein